MNGKVYGVHKVFGASTMDEEFEVSFVEHMWSTHGRAEVASSAAFKSYSGSKNPVAIARTSWPGFSAFLEHLQDVGKCRLRKDEGQRYAITMLDPGCSPGGGKRKAEDEKDERVLGEQIQRAAKTLRKHLHSKNTAKPGELQRSEKVSFTLPRLAAASSSSSSATAAAASGSIATAAAATSTAISAAATETSKKQLSPPAPLFQAIAEPPAKPPEAPAPPLALMSRSKMEAITRQLEAEKLKELFNLPRSPKWVDAGLIVRITRHPPRHLERFAKQEAVVEDVNKDGLTARIRLLRDRHGQRLTIEQDLLRTVVPGIGELVRVVNGGFKGSDGTIVDKSSRDKTAKVSFSSEIWKRSSPLGGYDTTGKLPGPFFARLLWLWWDPSELCCEACHHLDHVSFSMNPKPGVTVLPVLPRSLEIDRFFG